MLEGFGRDLRVAYETATLPHTSLQRADGPDTKWPRAGSARILVWHDYRDRGSVYGVRITVVPTPSAIMLVEIRVITRASYRSRTFGCPVRHRRCRSTHLHLGLAQRRRGHISNWRLFCHRSDTKEGSARMPYPTCSWPSCLCSGSPSWPGARPLGSADGRPQDQRRPTSVPGSFLRSLWPRLASACVTLPRRRTSSPWL